MEEDSIDGILPSVTVDKFLLGADMLKDSKCFGILLGHTQKFGKGSKSYTRNVVTTMVAGREDQLSDEPRL